MGHALAGEFVRADLQKIVLSTWQGRAAIDPLRVGIFGLSCGGFTALANVDGSPDFTKLGSMCQRHPGDFACQFWAISESQVAVPAICASPAGFDRAAFHVGFNAGVVKFFEQTFGNH